MILFGSVAFAAVCGTLGRLTRGLLMIFDTSGHSFERGIIMLNVRWYLSYKLSYRDLEEMASERVLLRLENLSKEVR